MERAERPQALPVDGERLRGFIRILQRYKAGKASVERRTLAAENWWKLRNQVEERKSSQGLEGFQAVSGWLHNVIVSKHADAMEAYPEPCLLPREPGDRQEAAVLGKLLPVILEHDQFEATYSDVMWQKLKTGTGVYKVYWDQDRLNGLGDIAIERVDLLNVFWEPGVCDIQQGRYFFHTRLEDDELLQQRYPQLKGRLKGSAFMATRFVYDDAVSTQGKSTVVDVYYKTGAGPEQALHYCKFVGDTILFSTENQAALEGKEPGPEAGLYRHGRYPFVFDSLFPIEGSPCGYGFIDLCQNSQTQIDMMQTAFIKNTMVGSVPRYFQRVDGAVNEEEFLDLNNAIIHVSGNLGQDSLRAVDYRPLSGNYMEMRTSVINELRETSGNTETSVGLVSAGVTAASAIAALQEASGKGSRDAARSSYRAYGRIVDLCIELIRQFYDLPRQFRIAGPMGTEDFISYTNEGLQPQRQRLGDMELGIRLPVFDIRVVPQKSSSYTRLSQNELALQFYQLGFFAPERADQALCCMEMMEFEGKEELMQQIAANGGLHKKLSAFQQYALAMTEKYEPGRAGELMASITGDEGIVLRSRAAGLSAGPEDSRVAQARRRAQSVAQPGGRA